MAYKDYLQSSHWKEVRTNRLNECDHCNICGGKKNLHIHHGRYGVYGRAAEHAGREEGSVLGREKSQDLFVFCASCHKMWHHHFGSNTYPRHKILNRLRRLLKHGVEKKYAFIVTSKHPQLIHGIIKEAIKRGKQP